MRLFHRTEKSQVASSAHIDTIASSSSLTSRWYDEVTVTSVADQDDDENDTTTDMEMAVQAFLDAAHRGHLDQVKDGIREGIDVNVHDDQGRTALHRATYDGHLDIVQYIIKECCDAVDIEARDNDGRTAFHYASDSGNLECNQYLYEQCHVNTEAQDRYGGTALHRASRNGHLNIVRYLIEVCQVNREAKNHDGWTALHNASRYGYWDMVQYLMEHGHVNVEAQSFEGRTALHFACYYGWLDIVQYILEHGPLHIVDIMDNNGKTPYDLARDCHQNDVVEYIQRMKPTRPNLPTITADPMMSSLVVESHKINEQCWDAARQGNLETVMECIQIGMDVDAKDADGYTALQYASRNGHLDIVQYLLPQGYSSNNEDTKGTAAFMALCGACSNGHVNIVQYLVERYHVDTAAKDEDGTSALHYASKYGHFNIVEYLIKTCHVDPEVKDMYGSTVFILASQRNHLRIMQYLVEKCHVNVEAKGNDGWTALHCASFNGFLNIVQYLTVICQVDPESKDMYGSTPLHLACQRGRPIIVQYLLGQCHVDKEAKDDKGWTALHYASSNDHLDIVKCLLEVYCVNKEATTADGETAFELAQQFNNSEIIQYFQDTTKRNVKSHNPKDSMSKVNEHENLRASVASTDVETAARYNPSASKLKHTDPDPAVMLGIVRDGQHPQNAKIKRKQREAQHDTLSAYDKQKVILELIDSAKQGKLNSVKECIDRGIDVDVMNKNGMTALHMASSNGHLHIVQYLVQGCHGNVEAKTNIGRTALHNACSNGQLDVVKYLIQTCHANTEVTDNDGWTPLHFSSRYGYLDVVKFLIHQCHVNVELSNNASETAYDLARKDDVIEYLGGVFADKQNSKNQFDPSVSNIVHLNQHTSTENEFNDRQLFQSKALKQQEQTSKQLQGQRLVSHLNSDSTFVTGTITAGPFHHERQLYNFELNEKWLLDLTMTLQIENQEIIKKLSHISSSHQYIDERREIFNHILVEKCETLEEQREQNAILSSPLHRDFYILLQRKLKCMIISCETMSTGMVGTGQSDLRSYIARTIREKGCNVLRDTQIGFFVANAVTWATKNLAAVPFIDSVGSVFQLIVTLKDERDRYLGLARVADFATMVCLQQKGTPSLDIAVERFARLIVRARCGSPSCRFMEDRGEFGTIKQAMVNLLADSGNTPAKEQASKAADCAFAHIMKPGKGSVLADILNGDTFDVSVHEALAASILGVTMEDLNQLDPFTMPSSAEIPLNYDQAGKSPCAKVTAMNPSNALFANASVSVSSTIPESGYASSDIVAQQEAKIQKQDAMIQLLSQKVARLDKLSHQSNPRVRYDAGGGLLYANPTEQFQNEITGIQTENAILDQRLCDQAAIIDHLTSRLTALERQSP